MAETFESLSTEELCAYLKQQIPLISEEIITAFKEHKIDGSAFVELNDEYLREVAPLIGDRLKIKRLINRPFILDRKLSATLTIN